MKKIFKVETIYKGETVWYAIYQKRFLWGWKFLGKFIFESDAKRIARELATPTTYYETKK